MLRRTLEAIFLVAQNMHTTGTVGTVMVPFEPATGDLNR